MAEAARTDRSFVKRHANDLIRAAVHSEEAAPIPFLCECPSDRCYRTVWLTAAEYDERFGAPLLAAAHEQRLTRRPA
jgi:hypothetical protein